MKMRMIFTVALMAIASAVNAQAISGSPFIAVHGEAKHEVTPDIFPVELTLSETSVDAAAAQAKIEALAKNVLAIAERMKINESHLTVSNLSISPEYKYDRDDQKQVFTGNTYQREIKVKFASLDGLRQFIASLPQDKALRIDTGSFETARSDEIRRKLLQKAIENARATAESMAEGVGRKLGPVHTISNERFNISYARSVNAIDVSGTTSVALLAPGVVAMKEGRITLEQDVYIVYALE